MQLMADEIVEMAVELCVEEHIELLIIFTFCFFLDNIKYLRMYCINRVENKHYLFFRSQTSLDWSCLPFASLLSLFWFVWARTTILHTHVLKAYQNKQLNATRAALSISLLWQPSLCHLWPYLCFELWEPYHSSRPSSCLSDRRPPYILSSVCHIGYMGNCEKNKMLLQ